MQDRRKIIFRLIPLAFLIIFVALACVSVRGCKRLHSTQMQTAVSRVGEVEAVSTECVHVSTALWATPGVGVPLRTAIASV